MVVVRLQRSSVLKSIMKLKVYLLIVNHTRMVIMYYLLLLYFQEQILKKWQFEPIFWAPYFGYIMLIICVQKLFLENVSESFPEKLFLKLQ